MDFGGEGLNPTAVQGLLGGSGGLSKYTHNPYYWPCDDTSYLVRELTYKAPWLFKPSVELPTQVVDSTMVLTIHYVGCHPCDDTCSEAIHTS